MTESGVSAIGKEIGVTANPAPNPNHGRTFVTDSSEL